METLTTTDSQKYVQARDFCLIVCSLRLKTLLETTESFVLKISMKPLYFLAYNPICQFLHYHL